MTFISAPVAPPHLPYPQLAERPQLTVFCDLDGPLIDVSQRYYRTYQLALKQTRCQLLKRKQPVALTPLGRHQFWAMKQARVPDQEIAMRSGLQGSHIDEFLVIVKDIVNQSDLLQLDRPQLGAGYALAQLRRVGIQLAVVTLRRQSQAVQVLEQHQMAHGFTTIRGTQDYGAAYDNYVHCKQALLTDVMAQPQFANSDQFWMIGDTEADILAAQALGVSTMAVTCGIRSRAYLERLRPDCIYPSLLAAAQCLLESTVRMTAPA